MYADIPLYLSVVLVLGGLAALAWSSDAFVDAASKIARALGVSPFIIGMVIIGFGTSAPELCVSALSSCSGHSSLSLGNAFGSDIFNIAGILGVAALIRPLVVKPAVVYGAVPALVAIAVFSCVLVGTGDGFSRLDGILQLAVFLVLLPAYCWFDQKTNPPAPSGATEEPVAKSGAKGLLGAWIKLGVGLTVLVGSSHVLVWGSVDMARALGVSELVIGLTIVAIGTSLPELASAVASARRGEHEFVLGNIIGSNFFNTLAVVGLAGSISPFKNISPYILRRDLPVMVLLSMSIALFGVNWRKPREKGCISRWEGAIWVCVFVAYSLLMAYQELHG